MKLNHTRHFYTRDIGKLMGFVVVWLALKKLVQLKFATLCQPPRDSRQETHSLLPLRGSG